MARIKREIEDTTVSTSVLGEYLDLTPRALQQLSQAGVFPKIDHGKFDLKVCVRAYIKHIKTRHEKMKAVNDASLTDQRARLTKAKADEAELKFKERSGELIPVEHIEAAWQKVGSVLRTRMLSLPSKLAPRLVTMKDAPAIQRLIDREISDALNELSKAKVDAKAEDDDSDSDPDQD